MKQHTWPIVALGSLAKFLSGGTPSKSEDRYWNGDIPWIGSGEMSEPRIYNTTHSVTYDGARNGTRLVPANTVLIVVRGMSLAKECRVSLTTRESTFNQDVKSLRLSSGVDPLFAFYYLRSQRFHLRDAASEAAHGTKKLDMPVLEQWPFPDVPYPAQRKIAAILTAYDDLIEVNKRRIALLEKMAEEIYREWFVRLRFPGHQDARFVKGVPEGWEIASVASLGKIITGKTPSTAVQRFYGGKYPFIKTPDMHGNMFVSETNEKLSEEGLVSQPAQTIPKNSLCVSCIGTGGIVAITTTTSQTNQQINTVCLTREEDLEWGYYVLRGLKESIWLFGSTGTTMTNLSKGKFSALKFLAPSKGLRNRFHKLVKPLFGQIKELVTINRNLTKTRDLLLPRLISGKLSVEDLDIQFPPSMQEDLTASATEDAVQEPGHA